MGRVTEWPHCQRMAWYPCTDCAMTGHWIMLPRKFNFLQLVSNTSQRHRAHWLIEGHSDIKEKKGNAGKWVLTVMFKEMIEKIKKKAHPPACYVFLDSECNSVSFPCITCAKLYFIQPWNMHMMVNFQVTGRDSIRLLFPLGMDWNIAAYSPNAGTTYSAKSNKKNSV